MKFLFSTIIILWGIRDLLVVHVLANSRFLEEMYSFDRNPRVTYKYDRMGEVQKQCASMLSASYELRYEYSVTGMKGGFSFVNGDWRQDGDVDLDHRLKKSIPINGFMVIGIARDGNLWTMHLIEILGFVYGPAILSFQSPLKGFILNQGKLVGKGYYVC
ncbi:hypothetical protein LR48_Vigan07g079500 [Vigna angularis]|uniref:Uncharacterized protein n=1 Tax=Phaseolus angularis TaxID=3914 RepID=A0A0L9UWJ1_PHAAN|nr:hypothetical protein LR48_Vigan07g079500 [Vigna angularis]